MLVLVLITVFFYVVILLWGIGVFVLTLPSRLSCLLGLLACELAHAGQRSQAQNKPPAQVTPLLSWLLSVDYLLLPPPFCIPHIVFLKHWAVTWYSLLPKTGCSCHYHLLIMSYLLNMCLECNSIA